MSFVQTCPLRFRGHVSPACLTSRLKSPQPPAPHTLRPQPAPPPRLQVHEVDTILLITHIQAEHRPDPSATPPGPLLTHILPTLPASTSPVQAHCPDRQPLTLASAVETTPCLFRSHGQGFFSQTMGTCAQIHMKVRSPCGSRPQDMGILNLKENVDGVIMG